MKRLLFFTMWIAGALACTVSTATVPGPTADSTEGGMPAATDTTAVETAAEAMTAVWVYYTMAADENMTPVPVARSVRQTDNPSELAHSALQELVKGPTAAEKDAGLISWFSAATDGTAIAVTSDGGAFTADFTGWNTLIPNASTSAGSQMLLSQLNSTMFQFDFVQSVSYTLDGNCAAFWEWLQMGCHATTRAEWEAG